MNVPSYRREGGPGGGCSSYVYGSEAASSKWNCAACTYENEASRWACEMCRTKRPSACQSIPRNMARSMPTTRQATQTHPAVDSQHDERMHSAAATAAEAAAAEHALKMSTEMAARSEKKAQRMMKEATE